MLPNSQDFLTSCIYCRACLNTSRKLVSFKALWTTILVGVVILSALVAHVVLIIHLVSTCLGMTLSLDLVPFVHATCFSELVDLTTDEAGEKLLGELVIDLFAWGTVEVSGLKRGDWQRAGGFLPSLR